MGRGGLRILGVTIALLCLVAAAVIPSVTEGKRKGGFKRSLTVKVKLPETGKIGYTHVVLKTRKARGKRPGGKRSAALAKRRKKPPLKLRIKNRKRLSSSVVVYARVSKLKRKSATRSRSAKKRTRTVPNTVVVDIVVINRRTAKSSRARSSLPGHQDTGAWVTMQPIIVTMKLEKKVVREELTRARDNLLAPFLAPADMPEACGKFGAPFLPRLGENFFALSAPKADRSKRKMRDVFRNADRLYCDQGGVRDGFFVDWGADAPFLCSGTLTPYDATEFIFNVSCNQATIGIGIQVPNRQITAFLDPSGLTCQVQTRSAPNDFLNCTGPVAANTPAQGNLRTGPGPITGMDVHIFGSTDKGGEAGPFTSAPLP